jgi:dolichol kinase
MTCTRYFLDLLYRISTIRSGLQCKSFVIIIVIILYSQLQPFMNRNTNSWRLSNKLGTQSRLRRLPMRVPREFSFMLRLCNNNSSSNHSYRLRITLIIIGLEAVGFDSLYFFLVLSRLHTNIPHCTARSQHPQLFVYCQFFLFRTLRILFNSFDLGKPQSCNL